MKQILIYKILILQTLIICNFITNNYFKDLRLDLMLACQKIKDIITSMSLLYWEI